MNSLGTSNARIKISPAVISRTEMPVTVLDLAVKVFPFLEQYSRLEQPVIVKFETGFLWKIEAYCQGTPLSVPEVVWVNPRLHMAKIAETAKGIPVIRYHTEYENARPVSCNNGDAAEYFRLPQLVEVPEEKYMFHNM